MKHKVGSVLFAFLSILLCGISMLAITVYADYYYGDNFFDDRIIVSLSNEASKKLKDYSINDFSELSLKRIEDLTINSKKILSKERENLDAFNGVSIDKFNQTLCLYLREKGRNNVINALKTIKNRTDVISAAPDYYTELESVTPSDEYFSNQWAIDNINLTDAWEITTGSIQNPIKVGILDTGIQGTHPDLSSNIASSLCVDCTTNPITYVGTPTDSGWHGTHVAGIIGAKGNNNIGIAGTMWNLKMISLQTTNSGYGATSNYIRAVDYANSQNIPILNCSNGWKTRTNDDVFKIIISNYSGLFICAAGNDNKNLDECTGSDIFYPACFDLPNMIKVASSDENNNKYSSSNYGSSKVDLFAPGANIYSTIPNSTYDYKTGTSMATPYVTGVAALIKSIRPDLSAEEIKKLILNNVDTVSSLSGLCVTGGKLNAYKAVRAATERQTFLGDVNGDGYKDIIMSGKNSNNNRVLTTLLGNSNGSFTNETSFTSTRTFFYRDLAYPGDFNGDGKTDLLIHWKNNNYRQLLVYLGNSNGSFSEGVNLSSIRYDSEYEFPVKYLVMDVNNDGCDDFVAVYKNSSGKIGILVYKGKSTSPYMLDATTNALTSIYDYFDDSKIYSGDFNNDGYSDILVPTYDSNEKRNITIYTGKSDGTFNEGQLLISTKNHKPYLYPYKYLVGDYNGDGYSDFLTTYKESGYRKTLVYSGKTSTPYINDASYMNSVPLYNYSLSDYVFSGDVNGDSYDDLIVHYKNSYGKRCLRVYNGNLTNMFENVYNTTTTNNHNENQYPCGVYSSDVNDDGYCDIIVKWKDGDNSRFYVYKGKNDSTFTSAISTTTNTSFYS